MVEQDRGGDAEPNRDRTPDVSDTAPTAPLPSNAADAAPQEQPADREPAGPQPAGEPPAGPPRPATGPSGTAVLPPAHGAPPSEPPRWSARAQVPTPHVEDYMEEWVPVEPSRGVLVPVLVTISVLLLAGILGVGVWLMLDNRPQPVLTETAAPTEPATTTTTTTRPPTRTPSPTPTTIMVPPLTGETYEDAERVLIELGLRPEREDVVSDAVPPGRVVGTSPTAGTRVAPGDSIIIFVARSAPTPTATPSPTASASPSPAAT
jgi:Uncharacterized protein conserved in bacteria